MAQLINVRLSRGDASPWGFRLQGGKDFGQPLLIQKVNGGSPAERAGLQVGDALVRVNGIDVQDMRHKEAQDNIVRAGNNFELSVQRGGLSTWKPHVAPIGNVPAPGNVCSLPVTKTSLAAKPSTTPIPSGHNVSPRPFGTSSPQLNGGDVKAVVNKQYNSPIGVYSEETIAETLSAQTEVLATGALGVNFMKNEKSYDSQKSEVFKMVQEVDQEPREPEPAPLSNSKYFSTTSHAVGGRATSPRPLTPIARQMGGPPELPQDKPYMPPPSPLPGSPTCSECGKHIVGVFVRIKDKNLHVECFKCATCGTSLKNVGYYTINSKLYCDIHAKMVARQNPPAPNLDPITVPPGNRIPAGAVSLPAFQPTLPSTISRAPTHVPASPPASLPTSFPPSLPTAAPQSPQPGTLAPLPFHTPSAPAPKPFGSVAAPAPQPPSAIPFTPSSISSNFGSTKQTDNLNPVLWPPVKHQVSISEIKADKQEHRVCKSMDIKKRMSICSEEVSSISEKLSHRGVCGDVSEIDERRPPSPVPSKQLELIVRKNVVAAAQSHEGKRSKRVTSKTVSQTTSEEASGYSSQYICLPCGLPPARSDSPDVLDISSKPKEIKSLLPPAAAVRPMTPTQRVVFPPNIPEALVTRSRSPSPLPGRKKVESKVKGTPPFFVGLPVVTPNPEPVLECKVEQLEPPTQQCPVVLITQDSVEDQNLCQELEDSAQTTETVEIDQTDTETTQTEEIVGSVDRLTVEKVKVQTDNPIEDKYYSKTEVEQIVKEELQKVFLNLKEPPKEEKPPELSLDDLPKPIIASGDMAMALSTASDRPFTPMPFPKVPSLSLRPDVPEEPPKKKTVAEKYMPCPEPSEPYFPPAPPPPESEKKDDRTARALREVGCRSPMTEALTVASTRSYSPLPSLTKVSVSQSTIKDVRVKSSQQTATVTSCPIKQVKPPLMIEKSAFTSTGNGSLVPKSTPLVYIPHLQRNQTDSQSSERHGIPRDEIAHQGKTKQVVAGLETTTSETLTINDEQLQAMKCKDVQYSCAVARNPPPQPEGACAQKVPTSGLRSEHLLPYYQQYIGDIPVRNRVLSPIPHPIKAPSMAPVPMPTPPNLLSHPRVPVYHTSKPVCAEPQKESFASKQICCMSGRTTSNQKSKDLGMMSNYQSKQSSSGTMMSAQQSKEATISSKMAAMQVSSCQESRAMQQSSESSLQSTKTISQTSASSSKTCKMTSRTSRMSSPLAGKSSTLTSSGKQTFKPDIPARSLSPSWKADYVRSVQNLSPITVRLPSPQPPPLKPKGELTQTTSANVHVKNTKPKTSSSRSKPPTSTTQSSKGAVGSCGTSKGCGTPPGSPTGRRSPGELKVGPCGTSRGCGTPPGSPKSRLSPVDIKVGPCGTSKGCNTPPGSPTGGETTGKQLNSGACQAYSNKSCMKQNTQFSSSVNKENLLTYKKSSVATQDTSLYKTGSLLTNYQNTAHNGKIQTRSNKSVSVSEVDASHSHFNVNHHRTPLQPIPSSPNTLWPSFPANLPLPRNCGVNPSSSGPNAGGAGGLGGGRSSIAGSSAPRRGRGVLNAAVPIGGRVPLCGHCNSQIRGPFITALGKIWCPEHFVCVNPKCKRPLQDIGFVEEDDGLYCEFCFEQYLAPPCDKCHAKIKGDCLNAIGKHFHPECFKCSYCEKLFGNNPFFLEDGLPYCENDWNELFTTKCFSCGFPIEAGDRWVEALNNNYHSQCFNCTMCKKNLDGQSFFAKGGRPFCKNHAR